MLWCCSLPLKIIKLVKYDSVKGAWTRQLTVYTEPVTLLSSETEVYKNQARVSVLGQLVSTKKAINLLKL